jgi:hypothetical protein
MASAKDIRFDQRNVTNTAYQEKYVNGNSLIIRTDSTGSVVGASTLEGVAIGKTTPSTANFTSVTASVISASVLVGSFSGSVFGTSSWSNNSLTASYFGSGSNNYFPFWSSNKLSYNSLISQSYNQISILSDTASFLGNGLVINKSDPFYVNNNPTIDVSNSPNQTLMLTPNVILGGNGNSENWNRFNSDGTVDFLGSNIKFTSGGVSSI